jgi:phage/plasmid-like protein (TIGR03299 family)
MPANIDSIAYLGSRNDVWHRLGKEMPAGQPIEVWAKQAGLDWTAEKSPAFARLPSGEFQRVDGQHFLTRSDNSHPLGYVSDMYQTVQPIDILNWFQRYIAVDERFQLDVAGSLKQGEIIWATATYRDKLDVAGDSHVARVLMTTTFDGSGATINQGTMTRVVCNNTLNAALADKRAVIRTRHNTKFDPARVGRELAAVAQGFAIYKKMGDALALNEMSGKEVSNLFKHVLDIPFETEWKDLSARKQNQFDDLKRAYRQTTQETQEGTAWAALNAVTRYVDHAKSVRGEAAISETEKRFTSAQFGQGSQIKAAAWDFLTDRIGDKVAA